MRNYFLKAVILSLLFLFFAHANVFSQEDDYEKIKKEYKALLADRDNLLAQTKNLLEYKKKNLELEESIEELKAQNEQLTQEIKRRISQIQIVQDKVKELENARAPLIEERDSLKNSL